ncbi:MAG: histone H1 [Bacteroides sp.]|nr:histone H1 [Bacteroides sp.]
MNEIISEIENMTASFLKDARSQLDKGNKAAGLRARRASLNLEPLLKRFRKASLEASNSK